MEAEMSAASVIHPNRSGSSSLSVVPFPASGQISQLELAAFLSLRGRLHQLELQVTAAEQSLQNRLEFGATIESGDHSVELKPSFRRNVAWRAVVIRLAERLQMHGEAYCQKVLSSTKPTRTVSLLV